MIIFSITKCISDKSNLKTIIELNQLGSIGLEENANLYVHKDPVSYSKNESIRSTIDEYIAKLTSNSTKGDFFSF